MKTIFVHPFSFLIIFTTGCFAFFSCTGHIAIKQSTEEIVTLKMECQAPPDETKDLIVRILQKENLYQAYKKFDDKVRIYSEFKNFPGPKKGLWKLATRWQAQCQYVIDITPDLERNSISRLSVSLYVRIRPNEKWEWKVTSDYPGYGDDRARFLSELQSKLTDGGICE